MFDFIIGTNFIAFTKTYEILNYLTLSCPSHIKSIRENITASVLSHWAGGGLLVIETANEATAAFSQSPYESLSCKWRR